MRLNLSITHSAGKTLVGYDSIDQVESGLGKDFFVTRWATVAEKGDNISAKVGQIFWEAEII